MNCHAPFSGCCMPQNLELSWIQILEQGGWGGKNHLLMEFELKYLNFCILESYFYQHFMPNTLPRIIERIQNFKKPHFHHPQLDVFAKRNLPYSHRVKYPRTAKNVLPWGSGARLPKNVTLIEYIFCCTWEFQLDQSMLHSVSQNGLLLGAENYTKVFN